MLHYPEIVRDEKEGKLELPLQVLEKLKDLCPNRKVKCAHRLIANEQFRLRRNRPCNANALALPPRELMGIFVECRGIKADKRKQILRGRDGPAPVNVCNVISCDRQNV